MIDGMKTTTYRTTFALDEDTAQRLALLASEWGVSRAEAVRRSVALAARRARGSADAVAALQRLHECGGGLVREVAERYLAEVRKARREWRKRA